MLLKKLPFITEIVVAVFSCILSILVKHLIVILIYYKLFGQILDDVIEWCFVFWTATALCLISPVILKRQCVWWLDNIRRIELLQLNFHALHSCVCACVCKLSYVLY